MTNDNKNLNMITKLIFYNVWRINVIDLYIMINSTKVVTTFKDIQNNRVSNYNK